jgi:hypothetical protein
VAVGQRYGVVICNRTAFTDTLAGGSGVTLTGTTSVAAGTCGRFGIYIKTVTTPAVIIIGG